MLIEILLLLFVVVELVTAVFSFSFALNGGGFSEFLRTPFFGFNFICFSVLLSSHLISLVTRYSLMTYFQNKTISFYLSQKHTHFNLFVRRLLWAKSEHDILSLMKHEIPLFFEKYKKNILFSYVSIFLWSLSSCYLLFFPNIYYFSFCIMFLLFFVIFCGLQNFIFIKSISSFLSDLNIYKHSSFLTENDVHFLSKKHTSLFKKDLKGKLIVHSNYDNVYLKESFLSAYMSNFFDYVMKDNKKNMIRSLEVFTQTFQMLVIKKPDIVNQPIYIKTILVNNNFHNKNYNVLSLLLSYFSFFVEYNPEKTDIIIAFLKKNLSTCFIEGNYNQRDFSDIDIAKFDGFEFIDFCNILLVQKEKINISNKLKNHHQSGQKRLFRI